MIEFRESARALRHEPDAAMLARIRSGVRARIAEPPSVWEILAGWLRPAVVSLAAVVILGAGLFVLVSDSISPDAIAEAGSRIVIDREVTLE